MSTSWHLQPQPPNVYIRREVCRILGMKDPYLVTVSPDKSNVIYEVKPYESLEVTFMPIIDQLRKERSSMERTKK